MDANERAALLAAMYDPEPAPAKRPDESQPDAHGLRRSRRMVMGAVSFDIPTVEYTAALETRVMQQERQIADLIRQLKRHDISLSLIRSALRRQSGAVGDIGRELDRRYERSDLP